MHQFRHGVRRERRQPGRDQSRRGADAPRGSGRGELMRHRARGTQLSRTASHKRATLANLATSLLEHDRIVTTEAKAKELRPYVERLITLARRGGLHARRPVERRVKRRAGSGRVFKELGPRFAAGPGGGPRRGFLKGVGFDTLGAGPDALGLAVHQDAEALEVGVPPPSGLIVRVADVVTEPRPFATDIADSSHQRPLSVGESKMLNVAGLAADDKLRDHA